jgi:hypothetical protein
VTVTPTTTPPVEADPEVRRNLVASRRTRALGGAALSVTIENRTAAAAKLATVVNSALQGVVVAVALT